MEKKWRKKEVLNKVNLSEVIMKVAFLLIILLLIGIVFIGGCSNQELLTKGRNLEVYHSEQYNFEFKYPNIFVVGEYKKKEPDEISKISEALQQKSIISDEEISSEEREKILKMVQDPFPNSIVQVEKSLLGDIPATEIPVGEIPTITIQPHAGEDANFYNSNFNKPEYRVVIGDYKVAKLPGYPAPYGEYFFYYVLVKSDDLVIELFAEKTKSDNTSSNYDKVIEKIISTFVFKK